MGAFAILVIDGLNCVLLTGVKMKLFFGFGGNTPVATKTGVGQHPSLYPHQRILPIIPVTNDG
jgi:hypothetical protein